MDLFYWLFIVLLATRIFGEVAARFEQPVLVGELLSGVLLGVLARQFEGSFPVLAELHDDVVFEAITDLGIFFLMLLAGIEMRPRDISKASVPALAVALGGMVLPMGLGLGLGWLALPESDWKPAQMTYLGVALSVTAVPITVATLLDVGALRSRVGSLIVSAAVFDDLVSLVLLAVLTSMLEAGTDVHASVGLVVAKAVVFLLLVTLLGRYAFPAVGRLTRRLKLKHVEFSVLLAWGLAFSLLAELLGMHFVLGGYAAGLFFTRRTIDEEKHTELHARVEAATLGFLGPIFFASIGLEMELGALTEIPGFLAALVALAFVGKIAGSGAAARACGFSHRDSLAIGFGMNARGAVELVIAGIALRAGLFSHPEPTPPVVHHLFSAVVLMAILAALVSPIGLRAFLRRGGAGGEPG